MAEEKTVFEQTLKHKGFFGYSDLYTFCYNWFKNEGYSNIAEEEYIEKVSGASKEIQIKWKVKKKVTDYYQYVLEVKWHILGMSEVEVEENGKKIKTNKGEVKIVTKALVKRDYEDTWDKSPFYKTLRGIYDKYIMRTTAEEYEDTLTAKAQSFVEDTKAFLNLEGKR